MHLTNPTPTALKASTGKMRSALFLAGLAAFINYLVWSWVGASIPAPAPNVAARVNGLTYAPFGRSDAPWIRHVPAAQTIAADMQQMASITGHIRTYSASQFPELPALAAQHGLQLTLGAWLNGDPKNNEREIAAALRTAAQHSNVTRLVIGNETVLKQNLTPVQLIGHLKSVRAVAKLPVSTAEPWHVWIKHPELAEQVDFITIHLLPYWEGVGLDTAVDESLERMARVRARFPGKQIVIGEIGYPSSGDSIKRAHPSPAVQAAFTRQFVARATQDKLDYFLIEAYDQPWKQNEEGRAGAYWGMFDAARQPKFAFGGPVVPDTYWQIKAIGSSSAGFVFLVWFLTRFATLSRLARTCFAATAQGVLSVATVVVTLPLLHYMGVGDWVMLALLIPTSLIMVAILLAHLFEFVELFWRGSLRRSFEPIPLPLSAEQPFVSVHLACCNEPPEMVIATIQSLCALDYQAYEVIVVDNNTTDAALWQPVRNYMANLPSHFRFIRLPQWPGYKAGALNFALTKTNPRAEVVAIVDADYVVKPEWLRSLVGYFADNHVGIVQAPQAHRDWGGSMFRKMMNWEYDGFFRIGMHHRNERDAIIQHGTMTMIRASALREHGRWSEWCMCEDTELGLRLMQQDLRTVYVDQIMGEGLTPDSFAAFKKQRQRWAQGGMQILKAHWRVLLGDSLRGKHQQPARGGSHSQHATHTSLSLGQRYHFLAGWLPWIGDLLHFIFVFAALAWTMGVLALPQYFALPVVLYMLPLAVFCSAKLVMGPLLYWRRVPCSIGGIVGAAIAGMALSHAIARGVLAGLFYKSGVFQITSKGKNPASAVTAKSSVTANVFAPAREELLLLCALLLAIIAVALTRSEGHTESALWMLMLALQALPYVASLLCAIAASWPQREASTDEGFAPWFKRMRLRHLPRGSSSG
jgi:exo-beta-1,3-glucanase (GH17 family)/cellulose synthase/poly-beta-1,6-N-acetylglucosamine synthase-like glycosyltransferase